MADFLQEVMCKFIVNALFLRSVVVRSLLKLPWIAIKLMTQCRSIWNLILLAQSRSIYELLLN